MYHAPVPLDLDQQEMEPAELADESVGADASSQRLRDAHLHNGQARRGRCSRPFSRVTGAGAALLVAWAMFGTARIELIVGWLALVAFANWTSCRSRRTEGAAAEQPLRRRPAAGPGDRRGGRPRRRLVGASRPTPSPPSRTQVQVVIGGAMGAMIMAAIAPRRGPGRGLRLDRDPDRRPVLSLIYLGSSDARPKLGASTFVLVAGGRRLRRRPADPLDLRPAQDQRRRPHPGEIVRLLLKEYEHRGVGWLWQVDAENRVIYISLADDRAARPPGEPADRPFAALARSAATAALGRILLASQPFDSASRWS